MGVGMETRARGVGAGRAGERWCWCGGGVVGEEGVGGTVEGDDSGERWRAWWVCGFRSRFSEVYVLWIQVW